MTTDTKAMALAVARSAEPNPREVFVHATDHQLRSAIADLIEALAQTTTSSQALAIANLLKDHIEVLCDVQTMARVRASRFISRDPWGG